MNSSDQHEWGIFLLGVDGRLMLLHILIMFNHSETIQISNSWMNFADQYEWGIFMGRSEWAFDVIQGIHLKNWPNKGQLWYGEGSAGPYPNNSNNNNNNKNNENNNKNNNDSSKNKNKDSNSDLLSPKWPPFAKSGFSETETCTATRQFVILLKSYLLTRQMLLLCPSATSGRNLARPPPAKIQLWNGSDHFGLSCADILDGAGQTPHFFIDCPLG